MDQLSAIVATAVLLSRSNSRQDADDLTASLTRALSDAILDDLPLDPAMLAARFNFDLKRRQPYSDCYARTMPAYDRTRIPRAIAERTHPDDLVALDASGWSVTSQGDAAPYTRTIGDVEWRLSYADDVWHVMRHARGAFTCERSDQVHATATEAIAAVDAWIRADRRRADMPLAA